MLGRVKRWIGGRIDVDGSVRECRMCGETVIEDAEECPRCGSSEIAEYALF